MQDTKSAYVLLPKDLERRDLSHKEKLYLREQNVITETQCTLGKFISVTEELPD